MKDDVAARRRKGRCKRIGTREIERHIEGAPMRRMARYDGLVSALAKFRREIASHKTIAAGY